MNSSGVSSIRAQTQSITLDYDQRLTLVNVNRLDRFYFTNQALSVTGTQNDDSPENSLNIIVAEADLLIEASNGASAAEDQCEPPSSNEPLSSISCDITESHSNTMETCIPPSLQWSPYHWLTHVNLTVRSGRPTTVLLNIEFCERSLDELSFLPLNKSRTLYIAYPNERVTSVQESVCHDREVTEYKYHLDGKFYKSVVTNTQPAVVQHNLQQEARASPRKVTSPLEKQTSRIKSRRRKPHLKRGNTKRRISEAIRKQKYRNSKKGKKNMGNVYHSNKSMMVDRRKNASRPRIKAGNTKHYRTDQETQPEKSRESNMQSAQLSDHNAEEIDCEYNVDGKSCKNIVTNTEDAVVPQETIHKRSKEEMMMNIYEKASRPPTKAGNAKLKSRTDAQQESQSGSRSSLKFSTELTALNVLKEHARYHPLEVLVLPTKNFSSDSILSSAGRLSRQRSVVQQHRSNTHDNVRHRVRDQARLRYMESHRSASRVASVVDRAASDATDSMTQDAERDCVKLRFTRLPFDSVEITQLLHASDYSKIIQHVKMVSVPQQPDSIIPTLFISGVAYFKMFKYEQAREEFAKCAATAKESHRDGDVMLCNAYLGDIEYASHNFTKAAHYYKTAVSHHSTESVAPMFKLTPPSLSAVHAKLASAYRNASMMVQAIQHYRTAIGEAQVDRDRLSAHTSLGNLYQSMGDNSNALVEYNKSIELAEKLSDYVSLGWAHGNIGNAYLGLNRKDEAVHHLQKSLDFAVQYETTPQAIGRTYNNLGTAYQSMNDLDKAEEYYDLALSQAVYGNDIAGQARVYGNIGNVHMLRKNYERAIPHYSEVLRLSSDPATISTARHNRGCAYYDWATSLQPKKTYHGAGISYKQAESSIPLVFHGPDCDVDECLIDLNSKAKDLYRRGCDDLKKVVQHHEERLQHIKGSPRGLTLSVSLFESNSRTFHRLQDCLVSLHKFEEALVVAEQSRARTLGELLLKRKGEQVKQQLNSPLSFDEIESIMKALESPVLYFSYTGARLICWLFFPHPHKVSLNAFEIPLADDQFNGKSFDYLLRYSLTENLVERSFEMYQAIKYDAESSSAVQELYRLVGEPTLKILQQHHGHLKTQKVTQDVTQKVTQKVTTISDSYTSLLPLTCLFDNKLKSFLGDHYFFNQIPSLLTLGVINQFPSIQVDLREDSGNFCVVGDPNIPPFFHNGELWSLGRLPHARKEAEWVSHALHTTPVLGDQATKSSLLIRLMNAKVVHIATHGSASAGFLAFASFAVHASERSSRSNQVHGSNVLLYPEDVEKLNISPALVVLSSCDSGRGVVKADGIQGMARAFILAGAQSVLTTLWKIPDESASVFMQFFYQYLIDKMKSTLALQKAILSVRCFAKYSQYIHWSGYQLTGRDIQFLSNPTRSFSLLKQRLGEPSIFPQLSTIKKLENALVNGPCLPTDVQLVKGCPGVNPAEVVVDFIFSFHKKFSGGIFWINCSVPELTKSSIEHVEKVTGTDVSSLPVSEVKQALFIFDNMSQLPELEGLHRILKSSHVHIIVLSTCIEAPDKLIKDIDRKLVRGTFIHNIAPLTMIHSTQRIVHSLLKKVDVTPANADQEMFDKLAEFTAGSPVVVDIASEVVLSCYNRPKHNAVPHLSEMLAIDHKGVQTPSALPTTDSTVTKTFASSSDYKDVYKTSSVYDSWESITTLLEECELSPEERLLLNCLSIFGRNPMPFSLVTQLSSLITQTTQKVHLAAALHRKLLKFKLLKRYPLPVVFHSLVLERSKSELPHDLEYVYVPQLVSRCLWNSMEDVDKVVVLSIAYSTLELLLHQSNNDLCGLCSLLLELFEENYSLVGEQCYRQMYSLFLNYK